MWESDHELRSRVRRRSLDQDSWGVGVGGAVGLQAACFCNWKMQRDAPDCTRRRRRRRRSGNKFLSLLSLDVDPVTVVCHFLSSQLIPEVDSGTCAVTLTRGF